MAIKLPEVNLRADQVIARFGRMSEALRARLRAELVPVTKVLAARVRLKLQPGALGTSAQTGKPLFEHTNRLLPAVTPMLVENVNEVTGKVFIDSAKFPEVAALSLEYGARAHEIAARNASSLFFFWGRLGRNVAFQRVHHPGFPGASYLRSALKETRPEAKAAFARAAAGVVKG